MIDRLFKNVELWTRTEKPRLEGSSPSGERRESEARRPVSSERLEFSWRDSELFGPSESRGEGELRRKALGPHRSAAQLWIERDKLKIPESFPDSLSVASYDALSRLAQSSQRSAPALAFGARLSGLLAEYSPQADPSLEKAVARVVRDGPTVVDLPNAAKSSLEGVALSVSKRLDQWPGGLSRDIKRILVNGVAFIHGSAEEPLLGATSALDAAAALSALKPAMRHAFLGLFESAQSDVEKALLLEALAVRSGDLIHGNKARSGKAWGELGTFAGMIRGLPADVLISRSTVIHADESIRQDFGNSCVGASVCLGLSAADPYVAWVLNSENGRHVQSELEKSIVSSDRQGDRGVTWDFAGRTYRSSYDFKELVKTSSLTRDDGRALRGLLETDDSSLGRKLGELNLPGSRIVERRDWEKVEQLVSQADHHFPMAAQALAQLQTELEGRGKRLPSGFQSVGEIVRGTIESSQGPAGIAPDHGGNTYLSPYTHLDYNRVKFIYRLEADPFHSERLAQIIESGQKVLLRRGDPEDLPENYSHCLTAYSVRGSPGDRSFYIVDSLGGYGHWVSQADFESMSSGMSYYFGDSHPTLGVGRLAKGRPEL